MAETIIQLKRVPLYKQTVYVVFFAVAYRDSFDPFRETEKTRLALAISAGKNSYAPICRWGYYEYLLPPLP